MILKKKHELSSFIVIILFICMHHTIVPSIVFGNYPYYVHKVLIDIIIITLTLLSFRNIRLTYNVDSYSSKSLYLLISPLLFLYCLELAKLFYPSALVGIHIFKVTLNLFSAVLFIFFLNNYVRYLLNNGKNVLLALIKPYVYFCVLIVGLSIFVFLLFLLGIIDVSSFPFPSGTVESIDNNVDTMYARYFFPLHSIVVLDMPRLPFFNDFGVFCGFSHEPHISTLLVTPSFFLLGYFFKNKKKILLQIFYVLFFLIDISATNILVLLIVSLIYFIFSFGLNNIKIIILFIFLSIAVYIYFLPLLGEFLLGKVDSGSSEYSESMLNYIVSPKSIIGYGVWNVPYPYTPYNDIGFIGMVGIFIQLFIFLYFIFKLILDKTTVMIALAGIYFVFHSFKIPQHTLTFPFTYYILFLLYIAKQTQNKEYA